MKSYQTTLRKAEHEILKTIRVEGNILDIGGDSRSEYRNLFQGSYAFTTLNIDPASSPDIVHDCEKFPLPLTDALYDGVLLMNVLEHIYSVQSLLKETYRVTKVGGRMIIVVPYMFPYHPSPEDYFRFSRTALKRLVEDAGWQCKEIIPLGTGVCSTTMLFLERLLPASLRNMGGWVLQNLGKIGDTLMNALARYQDKKYHPSDYALGFVLIAERP